MAYPTLDIDNSSTRTTVNLVKTDTMSNGTVRQRNLATQELFEFKVAHSFITLTEAMKV